MTERIDVLLLGAGAIGSAVAPLLAPLARRMVLVDRDRVGAENLAVCPGAYGDDALGWPKVDALARLVRRAGAGAVDGRFTDLGRLPLAEFAAADLVVLATDNRGAAAMAAQAWRMAGGAAPLIQGACDAESFSAIVRSFDPNGGACPACSYGPGGFRQALADLGGAATGGCAAGTRAPRASAAAATLAAALIAERAGRLVGGDAGELRVMIGPGRLIEGRPAPDPSCPVCCELPGRLRCNGGPRPALSPEDGLRELARLGLEHAGAGARVHMRLGQSIALEHLCRSCGALHRAVRPAIGDGLRCACGEPAQPLRVGWTLSLEQLARQEETIAQGLGVFDGDCLALTGPRGAVFVELIR